MFTVIQATLASALSVFLAYGVPLIDFVKRSNGKFSRLHNIPHNFCDLYVPEVERSNALFIFIHGGGWHSGSKGNELWVGHSFVGETMASRGVLTAVLTYPCARVPLYARAAVFALLAAFSVCLAEVLSFILFSFRFWMYLAVPCWALVSLQIWLREFATAGSVSASINDQMRVIRMTIRELRARYPLKRFVVAGHSAGGHLAMLYAQEPHSEADTVIGISGVYDMEDLARIRGPLGLFVSEFCLKPAFSAVSLERVSPTNLVAQLKANHVVLVSAYCDQPVLKAQADALYAKLDPYTAISCWEERKPGGFTKMRVTNVGLGHGFGLVWSEQLWTVVRSVCDDMPDFKLKTF